MKWGETQNLLSVIIGLNIAYYAFKEIRTPHLTALQRRINDLEKHVHNRPDDLGLAGSKIPDGHKLRLALLEAWDPIIDLQAEVNRLASSRKFENLLGMPAMLVGALGIILLIISTVKYEDALSTWLFYLLTAIGLTPVIGFIFVNYASLWMVIGSYEAKYHEYWNFIHLELGNQLTDYLLIIAEARLESDKGLRRREVDNEEK
jgi:hypothetical protein